ncbi:hypothetical protein QYF36_019534 [Acer negundo]|nr:hypothetical protein QYF36_019534 [Acer negundo]
MLMNIGEVTYDCGMWQINGLPCKHVVAVFMYNRVFLHDHVYWYYTKEAMKLAYNGAINAIPKESRLPEYHCEHIDPPTKRMKVARPKKIRKKAHDEPPAQSKIFSNRSQTCKTIGHNSCTWKRSWFKFKKEKRYLKGVLLYQLLGQAHQTGNGGSTNTTFQHFMTPLISASKQYSTAFSARNQEGTSTASQQHMVAPTHVPDGNALNQFVEEIFNLPLEKSEEDSHLNFLSVDSDSKLGSLTEHVRGDSEVSEGPKLSTLKSSEEDSHFKFSSMESDSEFSSLSD